MSDLTEFSRRARVIESIKLASLSQNSHDKKRLWIKQPVATVVAHMRCLVKAALIVVQHFLVDMPKAHPIVVVRHEVIEAVGRQQFLHALWQSEVCAGKAGADGLDRDVGALYDSLLRRGSMPRAV